MLLQIIDEAARRADEDVAAVPQRLALLVVVDAAVDGDDAEAGMRAEEARIGLDLDHELARGRDDEDARGGDAAFRRRRRAQAAREGRDQEGRRLARARLGLTRDVLALQRGRQRGLLDGRGRHEARVLYPAHHGLGEVERAELDWAQEPPPPSPGGDATLAVSGSGTGFRARRPKRRAAMIPSS